MKYKWIELYNYAGLYNGMGINQIKIDFTRCKTNKIIIRGSNGSGKSTLMKAINLNPDTNDNFIPSCEARKNICIVCDGVEYIIRYIHPITNSGRGTTKGYISKMINGQFVELNPNGNVTSCKDIIYEEFGLDSSFISLSSLSSENRGLVDSKPAERKRLINSIINTLEVYNSIYKNLSKKSAVYTKLIDGLVVRINYLGNEAQLNAKLKNIEGRLTTLGQEKNTTIEAIASVRLKISEYMDILRDSNYDAIVSELKDITSHNKVIRNQIIKKIQELGIDDMNKIEDFDLYLDKQIIIEESSIESTKNHVATLLSQREVEYRDLESKRQKLNSLRSEYNYLDIKKAMKKASEEVAEYDNIFHKIGIMNINLISKSEYDFAMQSLKYLKDMALNLTSMYDQSSILSVINNLETIENEIADISTDQQELLECKARKSEIDSKIIIYSSKVELIDELNNRPSECTIDSCPYIKTAIEASVKYPKEELLELNKESKYLEFRINTLENIINTWSSYKEILSIVRSIQRELNSRISAIMKLPVAPDFKDTFLSRVAYLDSFDDIDNLYKYIDYSNMIEEYKLAKEQLVKYESEYRIYEAKNDIIEAIIENIESLTQKTDNMMVTINELNSSIKLSQEKLESYRKAKTVVEGLLIKLKDDLRPSEKKETELLKIKQTLDVNSIEIDKLQKEMDILNTNFGAVNNDISNLSNERDNVKHSLIQIAEYKDELEVYRQAYSKINKIRYYSSPSTGIQTLFMQLYMNKIISTANDLLSMLFEGEFVLQPFIINENEFKIPCLGHGLIHDDISSMSTAQKCMISMILSFSILHQSSTKYNVISLDELDGGLDTMNRGFFIELLDRLMNMLQCEQCFIISHNNELTTSAADLILLKNNSGDMYDGNVIWQY